MVFYCKRKTETLIDENVVHVNTRINYENACFIPVHVLTTTLKISVYGTVLFCLLSMNGKRDKAIN